MRGRWMVGSNLLCKKGQKSRQGRRPSTRAAEAERAAIESPFHRCHRRSPAISLSPSTHGPPHQNFLFFFFVFFCYSTSTISCFNLTFCWFLQSTQTTTTNSPFISHALTHSQARTHTHTKQHTHRLTSWLNDQLQLSPNKKTKQVALGREGARQHRERRERERESHPFTTVGSTEMDPIWCWWGEVIPDMLTFLSFLHT